MPARSDAAPARRGRPPRISPSEILDAVEAKTSFDWTMASIASELGVSEPAIYYYFPGKQALLAAAGARVLSDLPEPDWSLPWEQWLVALAEDTFDRTLRHPFLQDVDMATAAATHEGTMRRTERLLEALVAEGFTLTNAVRAISLVSIAAHQFASALVKQERSAGGQQAELILLASHAEVPLLAAAYEDPDTWDVQTTFRSLLRVTVAGVTSELGPR